MAPFGDMFRTFTGACSIPARMTAAKNMLDRGWLRLSPAGCEEGSSEALMFLKNKPALQKVPAGPRPRRPKRHAV